KQPYRVQRVSSRHSSTHAGGNEVLKVALVLRSGALNNKVECFLNHLDRDVVAAESHCVLCQIVRQSGLIPNNVDLTLALSRRYQKCRHCSPPQGEAPD